MWNKDHSIRLSVLCTRLFLAVLAAGLLLVPRGVAAFVAVSGKPAWLELVLCTVFYLCSVPAALLLWALDRMLDNISGGRVFTAGNVSLLRRISWCCMAVALICLGGAWFFFPFLLVAAAAAFAGLILRVMKNVFQQAVDLKEENDYTI